ncbi:SIR2 family protein [Hymenobacter rubripertinctus]|uniref:SIR2-like domain-containing protein n=1 Tax=Hymenobacter rubripertinctus TaxID=2029981 RepID=A0A418QZ18_9BACT|nr:SIR2 family protein [Hymenobacter rubripertinctus]RIY10389.1 hypothetical protein D0T11_09280 [Hymenobacter rubripertinctus]
MKVSFLLGAGFSRPAGYPLASELSSQILRLQASGIATYTNGQARLRPEFLAHLKVGNESEFIQADDDFTWSHRGGVMALEAVLVTYGLTHELTNYEDFYDELYTYYQMEPRLINAPEFVREYEKRGLHINPTREGHENHLYQALPTAFRLFPQLLEQLLALNPTAASPGAGEAYQRFFNLIRNNVPRPSQSIFDEPKLGHEFCIHTLNHDELVEDYLHDENGVEAITYSDGFSEFGSPYYGRLDFGYELPIYLRKRPNYANVRMPRYTGEYDSPVQLLKLHGSLDYWSFGVESHDSGLYEPQVIRKQPWIPHLNLYREVESNGAFCYRRDFHNSHSLFLSGTTAKLEQYTDPILFSRLLKLFETNLSDSSILVIVGYGFRDEGINRLIMPSLNDPEKKVVVIGREMPEYFPAVTPAMFRSGGLEDYDFSELETLLKAGS